MSPRLFSNAVSNNHPLLTQEVLKKLVFQTMQKHSKLFRNPRDDTPPVIKIQMVRYKDRYLEKPCLSKPCMSHKKPGWRY